MLNSWNQHKKSFRRHAMVVASRGLVLAHAVWSLWNLNAHWIEQHKVHPDFDWSPLSWLSSSKFPEMDSIVLFMWEWLLLPWFQGANWDENGGQVNYQTTCFSLPGFAKLACPGQAKKPSMPWISITHLLWKNNLAPLCWWHAHHWQWSYTHILCKKFSLESSLCLI